MEALGSTAMDCADFVSKILARRALIRNRFIMKTMAIKKWLVRAEVNMDAGRYTSVVVEANTARKALIFGKKKLLENHFYVTNMKCELLEEVKK